MSLREPAWRVTTRELESSLEEEKGEGERPATYLLSPFAARMNRVIATGNLSPADPPINPARLRTRLRTSAKSR